MDAQPKSLLEMSDDEIDKLNKKDFQNVLKPALTDALDDGEMEQLGDKLDSLDGTTFLRLCSHTEKDAIDKLKNYGLNFALADKIYAHFIAKRNTNQSKDPINLSVDELFQEVNNHIVLIDKASESTRFNPFFVGRQKSIESAISCIKSNRDRLGTNPEKAKFQVPVCSGQVGVGKTSLALEIAKRYPQSPNEEVKIAIMDLKNGGGYLRGLPSSQEDWNSSVLLRILYYFFSSKGKDFQSFYATFSRYKQLHDPIVVSRLMNMKASLAKEQTLSFFFFCRR